MNVAQVTNAIAKVGKPGVLRRIFPAGRVLPVSVKHVSQLYTADEMTGGIIQGDQKVIMGNQEILDAGWPAPPIRGDQFYVRETRKTGTVQGATPMHLGEDVAMYILQVRGL